MSVKPTIRIHNQETDEVIDREMSDQEWAAFQEQKAINDAALVEAETRATQRQAILERLGITEDEARLLLG
jgi:Mg/Co/Ni transporter MgtE